LCTASLCFPRSAPPPPLRSFPTRRSSDLLRRGCQRGSGSALDDVDGEAAERCLLVLRGHIRAGLAHRLDHLVEADSMLAVAPQRDRKSTRLNSSHVSISYAVFCLKKKKSI